MPIFCQSLENFCRNNLFFPIFLENCLIFKTNFSISVNVKANYTIFRNQVNLGVSVISVKIYPCSADITERLSRFHILFYHKGKACQCTGGGLCEGGRAFNGRFR